MTRPIEEQLAVTMTAYADVSRDSSEVDNEMAKLLALWQKEHSRQKGIAQARADRLLREGKLRGRPRLELPSPAELRKRLQTMGVNKLARELGTTAKTLGNRLREGK